MTPVERVLSRSVRTSDGCLEWQGTRTSKGYGQVSVAGKLRPTHRVTYEAQVGPIPEGLEIDHLCRNRACVNPDHLEPVTHAENVRRAVPGDNSKTHCLRGHELAGENIYQPARGARQCRACRRIHKAIDKRRKREKKQAASQAEVHHG